MLSSKASLHELRGWGSDLNTQAALRHGLALVTAVASAAAQDTSQPPPLYREVEVANGGTVTGAVRFADEFPPAETFKIASDNQICGLTKPGDDFVVSGILRLHTSRPGIQVKRHTHRPQQRRPAAQRPYCRG